MAAPPVGLSTITPLVPRSPRSVPRKARAPFGSKTREFGVAGKVVVEATAAPVEVDVDEEPLVEVISAISLTQPGRVPQPVLVTQALVDWLVVVVVPLFETVICTHSGCSVGTGAGGFEGV